MIENEQDKMNKDIMPDEDLVKLAQSGNNVCMEKLLTRYRGLVLSSTRSYFLAGAETEDLLQEGMIGLFKAIRDFENSRHVPFQTFAKLCVTRQIATAIKLSLRNKHKPLNTSISLNQRIDGEDEGRSMLDTLESDVLSPETIVEERELIRILEERANSELSLFEKAVFRQYLLGLNYQDISNTLNCDKKAIDNALQRMRKKLSKGIE